MFKLPEAPKDSDLKNFYSDKDVEKMLEPTEKRFREVDGRSEEQKRDDLYKFKKSVSLTRNYELYLETEKAYYKFTKEKFNTQDPMTRLARKIKKGTTLYLRDLKVWVGYNFLVFDEEE